VFLEVKCINTADMPRVWSDNAQFNALAVFQDLC